MGCGSSKETTGQSPKKQQSGGGANNKRKSNAKPEQVDVEVKGSEADVTQESPRPSPEPGTPPSTRKDMDEKNNSAFTNDSNQNSGFESKQTRNGDVNGRARKSRYDERGSEQDEKSFSEANDKGYKRRVREKLKTATAGQDIEALEKMMALFERSHLDDCGDLTRARERLRYLKLRRDLRDGIRRRHVGVLDRTIADVKNSPYAYQLNNQLEAATKLRDHLKELNDYNHDILEMEQTTISELRSYQRPPSCVHDVMAATYMLLGHDEDRLTDWADIQCHLGKMGRDSLMRQVETFDTNDVDDHTAGRVKEILGYHDLDQVRAASCGAARFHVWANQMVDKIGKDKQSEEDKRRQEDEKSSLASSKGRKKKG